MFSGLVLGPGSGKHRNPPEDILTGSFHVQLISAVFML